MIRIRTVTAGALVAGMLVSGAAFAQGPRGGPGGRGGRGLTGGLPIASLNLTQAQQDLIRDIRERARTNLQPIEQRLGEAQDAQRKTLSAIPADEAAIRAATLALAEVQAEIAIQQARVQNEIFALLTAEQQAQLQTTVAEREQRMEQRQQQMHERREQMRERRGQQQSPQ